MSNLIKEHIIALQRKAEQALVEADDGKKKDGTEEDGTEDKTPKGKGKGEVNTDPKLDDSPKGKGEATKKVEPKSDEDDEDEDKSVKESVYDAVLAKLTESVEINVDDSLFKSICESQEFDDDFTAQASSIFSAAVKDAIATKVTQLAESASAVADELVIENFNATAVKAEEYQAYVNDYLEHVVTEWVAENKVELVESVRMEKATAFMSDMVGLFEKYNMEIPTEKLDLYEETCVQNTELQERAEQLEEANLAIGKELIMSLYTKDMSALATDRLMSIAESLEYTGDNVKFISTLDILREGVTGKRTVQESSVDEDFTAPLTEADETVVIDNMTPEVRAAVAAISRINR